MGLSTSLDKVHLYSLKDGNDVVYADQQSFYANATNGARIDSVHLQGDNFAIEESSSISNNRQYCSINVAHRSSYSGTQASADVHISYREANGDGRQKRVGVRLQVDSI